MADKKARYWECILWEESAIPNWREEIYSLLQLPFAYCTHDKDVDGNNEPRKVHTHIVLAFPNTTTYNNALKIFQQLGDVSTCKACINIRWCYDYLIHDTEDCKKKHKHLYEKKERICGNQFDIGFFEQESLVDKKKARTEISKIIIQEFFTNYTDLYAYIISNFEPFYEDVLVSYSGHFERLTKGNFLKRNDELNTRFQETNRMLKELEEIKEKTKKKRGIDKGTKLSKSVHRMKDGKKGKKDFYCSGTLIDVDNDDN